MGRVWSGRETFPDKYERMEETGAGAGRRILCLSQAVGDKLKGEDSK